VAIDDINSYHDLVTEEKSAIQKGMNYRVGKILLARIVASLPHV